MRSIGAFAACVAALTVLAAGAALAAPARGNPTVQMTVEGRGKVVIELLPKDAPKTVAHFLELVHKKFYDGIRVHRVEPGFVVQAGDPATRKYSAKQLAEMTPEQMAEARIGGGGSGKNIPFESNTRAHEVGTLGIALTAPRSATGDSQWFINLSPNHSLDGDYCVFAKVTRGMDVVRKIKRGDKIVSIAELKSAK